MSAFSIVDLIIAKRNGGELSDEAIRWALDSYVAGTIADEQVSALLMAIFFRGLDDRELATWTDTMIASGERLDLSSLSRPSVDKHSTGGVGDKISLILAPLVAACGAAVPQLSGRGLGHTGGTLDKLEAIPGWRAVLTNEEIVAQLESIGAVICAAGAGLAPADRKLYALRDVTGTVESIPLISSSIMSKKIAEGTDALVLDVKVGRGAFMKQYDDARRLAQTMVGLGTRAGVATVAQLTNMNQPLGQACGNGIEVLESIEVLRGGGPADVRELTLSLARTMLSLVGIEADPAEALDNGRAYQCYREMIEAQGGDSSAELSLGSSRDVVHAERDGYVTRVDAMDVGLAAWRLGAGRARKEDAVSPGAGVRCLVREGDQVATGQPLFELYADDEDHLQRGRDSLTTALQWSDDAPTREPLLFETITATSL
jgi:thymidine phosphorylase